MTANVILGPALLKRSKSSPFNPHGKHFCIIIFIYFFAELFLKQSC